MLAIRYFKTALLLAVAFSGTLFSESIEEFDRFIEEMRVQRKVPGVAVVIVQDDKIVFAKGYGLCRADKPAKVDENTIFQLASVSKTFTAASVGILIDQQRIKWDEEIIDYLPEFGMMDPYPTRYATSQDLLAHRTGLPAFGGDLLGKLGYSREDIISRVKFIEPATSFRNKAFYSNVGFFLAGELVAKLMNTTWENAVQSSFLNPLKMTRSGFAANLDNSNTASSHVLINGKVEVIPYDKSEVFAAAGGVTSTAVDMGTWMRLHLNKGSFEGKQILTPEAVKAMHAPSMVCEVGFTDMPPINEKSSLSYGLGWNNYNYKGHVIVEKGGALDGVRTVVTLIPESKIGITVLANLNLTVLPEIIRAKFLEMHLGKADQDIAKEFEKHEQFLAGILQPPAKPANALPLTHGLDQCVGSFISDLYGEFVISLDKDQLVLEGGPGHLQGKLTHWSDDTFILKWPAVNSGPEQLTFTFGPEGKAIEMQTESLGLFKRDEE